MKLWNKIQKFFNAPVVIIGVLFTFIPESLFLLGFIEVEWLPEIVIIVNKLILLIFIGVIIALYNAFFRKSVSYSGSDYTIKVEYSDIFSKSDCVKVINFDEIFTTSIGLNTADVKETSVCGQFLSERPDFDIDTILADSKVKPSSKSAYNNIDSYKPGTTIPFKDDKGEYLLLAFAKLDSEGRGCFTREEFLDCLNTLWCELDKYCREKDVVIPILGSGITRFKCETLTHQQLLDIIIMSYKLFPVKIKKTLHIVCKEKDEFSLNKIGSTL